jgi:hypothetical protein
MAAAALALASVTLASILLLLVLISLLVLVLLVLVFEGIGANSSDDATNDRSENSAASLVSYESSTCSTEQSCSETLLSVLSGTFEPGSWGSSYALAVIVVLWLWRVRSGVRRALLAIWSG